MNNHERSPLLPPLEATTVTVVRNLFVPKRISSPVSQVGYIPSLSLPCYISLHSFHLISPPIFKSHPQLQIKCQHIHHLSCTGFNTFSTPLASSFNKPILLCAIGSTFDAPNSFLKLLYLLLTLKNLWRRVGQYLILINPVMRTNLVIILTALFWQERLKKLQGFWFLLVTKNLWIA